MLTLELPEKQAAQLRALLETRGEQVEVIHEERFFGDADVVTLVMQHTESIVAILAGAVTLYDRAKVILTKDDGSSCDLGSMSEAEIKARMVL